MRRNLLSCFLVALFFFAKASISPALCTGDGQVNQWALIIGGTTRLGTNYQFLRDSYYPITS